MTPKTFFVLLLFSLTCCARGFGQQTEMQDTTIYTFVEVPPEFPGDDAGLLNFLRKNIVVDTSAACVEYVGKVLISFVVNERGAITDTRVTRGLCAPLDNAVKGRAKSSTFQARPAERQSCKGSIQFAHLYTYAVVRRLYLSFIYL